MDGLECSEVSLGDLEFSRRLDAEYYRKTFLKFDTIISSTKNELMGSISDFLIGPFGSAYDTDNYLDYSPFRYIRGQDVKPFILKDSDPKYIAESDYNRLSRYALTENDVMVSVVGTLGNACIVRKKNLPAIFSCKSTVIRTKIVRPEYLVAYLNCKYGRALLLRKERGAIQKGLNLDDLKSVAVPIFSDVFESVVARIIAKADANLDYAKETYYQAEQLLLSKLGMADFTPSTETVSVKPLSKSFLSSGRLDAEYYQPKYDKLFKTLARFEQKLLGEIVKTQKSIEPGSDNYRDEGIPFVRVSDITKYGISAPEIKLPVDVVPNVKSLYPQKDTILLSKDGSVGIAYKVERDLDVITSSALLHLIVKDKETVLPDYLALVLNSLVVRLQSERDVSGAIIQHWKRSEIEKAIIPLLNIDTQNEIANKIHNSSILRHRSEQLLNYAKQAVEMAIEQSEEKAIKWLNEKEIVG